MLNCPHCGKDVSSLFGRRGGRATSKAKARAAKKNARLGGRPAQYLAEVLEADEGPIATGARLRGIQGDGRRWIFQVSTDGGESWRRGYSDLKPKIRTD